MQLGGTRETAEHETDAVRLRAGTAQTRPCKNSLVILALSKSKLLPTPLLLGLPLQLGLLPRLLLVLSLQLVGLPLLLLGLLRLLLCLLRLLLGLLLGLLHVLLLLAQESKLL